MSKEVFGDQFYSAENGKIDYSQNYLENIIVTDPIEDGREKPLFKNARRVKVNSIKGEYTIFENASNCVADDAKASIAFSLAQNCNIGKIEATHALHLAENCKVDNIKAMHLLEDAKKCLVTKNIETYPLEIVARYSKGVVFIEDVKYKGEDCEDCEVFPSVIRMKDKTNQTDVEKIEFFTEELMKSQQGQESIFDYLEYFEWEGETLDKGKKILKGRYGRLKEKEIGNAEIDNMYFYYLVSDNDKREELLSGFKKLRKVERNSLNGLETDLFKLNDARESLSSLSLKEWINLSNYSEFIDYKSDELEIRKNQFNHIAINELIENADSFKEWTTAKHIKQLNYKNKDLDIGELKKKFNKEKKEKINTVMKNYILNSPKENLIKYLKEDINYSGELSEDVLFASRLHKLVSDKHYTNNKKILEELILGNKQLDYEKNRNWISKNKEKFNTDQWIKSKSKDYNVEQSDNYFESIEKNKKEQLIGITDHLKDAGINVLPNIKSIEEFIKINTDSIPKDILCDIENHISTYKSLSGAEQSELPRKITLITEDDPLKAIQMGQKVAGSCLRLRGGHEVSAICNAVDINKKIIWAKNEKNETIGRVLVGITQDNKLVRFALYNNDPRINLENCYNDFILEIAKDLKIEIANEGKIEEIVGDNWYDDGTVDLEK